MTDYDKEYREVRAALDKLGWKRLDKSKLEFASQGVIYADFIKEDKVTHLEFGDSDCVFGEQRPP